MLAPDATTAAAVWSPRGWSSASAADAVPVAKPAAVPLTTRAAISHPMLVATRNSAVLAAAQATAITSTVLRPMWSLRSPSATSANRVPATYAANTTVTPSGPKPICFSYSTYSGTGSVPPSIITSSTPAVRP